MEWQRERKCAQECKAPKLMRLGDLIIPVLIAGETVVSAKVLHTQSCWHGCPGECGEASVDHELIIVTGMVTGYRVRAR